MQLNDQIKTVLEALGATPKEEAAMLSYFETQLASAKGQVLGIDNRIDDLQRQRDAAQTQVEAVGQMISKFTVSNV